MTLVLLRTHVKAVQVVLTQPGVGLVDRFKLLGRAAHYMRHSTRLVRAVQALDQIERGHIARTKRGRKRQADRALHGWNDRVDWLAEAGKLSDAELDAGGPEMPAALQAALR